MKLKTITLVAAIAQLLVLLCQIAQWTYSLVQLANGHRKWEYEWMYILPMPIYLFAGIATTVFFFALALKQQTDR